MTGTIITKEKVELMDKTKISLKMPFGEFNVEEIERVLEKVQSDEQGGWTKDSIKIRGKPERPTTPEFDRNPIYLQLKKEIKREILQELKGKRVEMDFEDAEALVIDYITEIKQSGRGKVSLLELEVKLGVSEAQATLIMEKLKDSGVKEIG